MYDFVVVGVGPAGARFARRAAESGYDVLGLEKGTIGTPLACSGHVSTDIWDYVPDDAKADLLQNRVYGANFYTGGPDDDPNLFYKREEISNVIDRVELDRTLADCARNAGAEIREGHTVTGVDERADRVVLTVSVADETDPVEIEARMVAGCDGPVSRVRQAVELPEPAEKLHGVLAFTDEKDHSDYVDVHLTVPRFFAWRIPRGEAGVEYGLAAAPGEDVNDRFEILTEQYDVDTDRFCSGAIPDWATRLRDDRPRVPHRRRGRPDEAVHRRRDSLWDDRRRLRGPAHPARPPRLAGRLRISVARNPLQ